MSITANDNSGGQPSRRPPTAIQCALAVVTAGIAVAAVMLALVRTAQAGYVGPLPEQASHLQSSTPPVAQVQPSPTPTPPPEPACPPAPSATYSGTIRLDGQPAADGLLLIAAINGQAWATALISDGRYSISIPQDEPERPPCFPASGTILFTTDGYTCMPVEEGGQWTAYGYRSFTPGPHDADLACVPMPTPVPKPDDAVAAAASFTAGLDGRFQAATADVQFRHAHAESSDAARDAFLTGLIPYLASDVAAAKAAWEEILTASPSPEQRAQAHLWLGKLHLSLLGDDEGATAHFQQAVAAAPYSFYGLRAEAWLAGEGALLPFATWETVKTPPPPDWAAVEAWLASIWGPEPPTAWSSTLSQTDSQPQSVEGLLWLIEQNGLQPWSLYRLARAFHDQSMPDLAARAASYLLAMAGSPPGQTPRALLELIYPFAYPSLIEAATAENGVSPLLLLAVIRQESFFHPLAASPAGALGLAQVMPSTGQGIAAQLHIEGFSTSDLLRPEVSIRFGAYYLGSQLRFFHGNPYLALAAYNSGPDNARRWSQSLPAPDMDILVELIDFLETRTYVKSVLENYAIYRFLYGGADHPTLLNNPGP
ncbi:MAG: lytic transglycosylase domain-containing protein [Dehalococcoidia bacterium]